MTDCVLPVKIYLLFREIMAKFTRRNFINHIHNV